MPPAKSPPSCGAVPIPESLPFPPPVSELARARPGAGVIPLGAFGTPGIGGAPDATGPLLPDFLSIRGADRSAVTVGFSRVPFEISPSKAPCQSSVSHKDFPWQATQELMEHTTLGTSFLPGRAGILPPGGGGGGGGGPPNPGIGGGGGGGGGGPGMVFVEKVHQILVFGLGLK